MTAEEIESLVRAFETRTLPKSRWTHHAHLAVGLWYVAHQTPDEALQSMRTGILAYNESVGTVNSDTSGYHETLTRLYLMEIARHRVQHADRSLPDQLMLLLASPLGASGWPLLLYTRDRLFSVEARLGWVAPDRARWEDGSVR